MNIGIVGSRKRTRHEDYIALIKAFGTIYAGLDDGEVVNIVSGGCPVGADSWAHDIAETFNLQEPIVYFPDWEKYGRIAGLARNTLIANDADILIAVVAADRKGGTEDTIRKFKAMKPDAQVILV